MKEVFEVDTAAPGVIGFNVAIVDPIGPSEEVGAPETNIKFIVGVPLRAKRWSNLLRFLSRILRPGKRRRGESGHCTKGHGKLFHTLAIGYEFFRGGSTRN